MRKRKIVLMALVLTAVRIVYRISWFHAECPKDISVYSCKKACYIIRYLLLIPYATSFARRRLAKVMLTSVTRHQHHPFVDFSCRF